MAVATAAPVAGAHVELAIGPELKLTSVVILFAGWGMTITWRRDNGSARVGKSGRRLNSSISIDPWRFV